MQSDDDVTAAPREFETRAEATAYLNTWLEQNTRPPDATAGTVPTITFGDLVDPSAEAQARVEEFTRKQRELEERWEAALRFREHFRRDRLARLFDHARQVKREAPAKAPARPNGERARPRQRGGRPLALASRGSPREQDDDPEHVGLRGDELAERLLHHGDERVAAWAQDVERRAAAKQINAERALARLLEPLVAAGFVEQRAGAYLLAPSGVPVALTLSGKSVAA